MIKIPQPISPEFTFRWFVEFVIDHSPLFRTTSAMAKAGLILGADLDTVGGTPEIPEPALKLLRAAVTDEEHPLPLPDLMVTETQQPVSPRVWSPFINAISETDK